MKKKKILIVEGIENNVILYTKLLSDKYDLIITKNLSDAKKNIEEQENNITLIIIGVSPNFGSLKDIDVINLIRTKGLKAMTTCSINYCKHCPLLNSEVKCMLTPINNKKFLEVTKTIINY